MSDKAKKTAPKLHMPSWVNFVIGGASGMLAICMVQPMDLIKTRMQLLGPAAKDTGLMRVVRGIAANEGLRGFYTGISAALFRQATYTTARLGCFNGLLDLYKGITREEGVTTLWRGATATVTRAMVVNGAQLGTYAQAREILLPHLGDGIFLHFCSSMVSGLVTTFASLPVDIVKTRVQNAEVGASQIGVLFNVIKNEGVLALWSGFLPTYGKLGPHTVFTFLFLEQLNRLYYRLTDQNKVQAGK